MHLDFIYNLLISNFHIWGVIQSMNYPSPPDNDIYCEYVIDPFNSTENSGEVCLILVFRHEPYSVRSGNNV